MDNPQTLTSIDVHLRFYVPSTCQLYLTSSLSSIALKGETGRGMVQVVLRNHRHSMAELDQPPQARAEHVARRAVGAKAHRKQLVALVL